MLKNTIKLSAAVAALLASGIVFAKTAQPLAIEANAMKWKPLPSYPTLKYTVLTGDPTSNDFFVIRLKLPKDYTDIIHEHELMRYDTIISGALYVGFGNVRDIKKTKKLTAGSFIACPPGVPHYGITKQETVVQIAGKGPWKALKTAGFNR